MKGFDLLKNETDNTNKVIQRWYFLLIC